MRTYAPQNFPGAVTAGGARLLPGYQVSPNARPYVLGGRVLFVGNLAGGGYGDGSTPDKPLASLFGSGGALARLGNRVNKGDTIYVLPGHAESVSAADMASHTGTAAGFSVQGLGYGTQRGSITWTAADSTWLLDTAGVEIANLNLQLCATAATVVVTPITVSTANCRIVDCFINWGLSTTVGVGSTLGAIALVAAHNFEFLGNFALNLDVAGTAGQAICLLSINGSNYAKIIGNEIYGATTATTVGPVHFVTTLSSDVTITHNYIENLIASSTKALSSAIAGVTGRVAYNNFRVNSGIIAVTASSNLSTTFFQNYTSNTVNLNGALDVGGGTAT